MPLKFNLNLQKGHLGNFIFQLSTLLSNEFEANIQKLEGFVCLFVCLFFWAPGVTNRCSNPQKMSVPGVGFRFKPKNNFIELHHPDVVGWYGGGKGTGKRQEACPKLHP